MSNKRKAGSSVTDLATRVTVLQAELSGLVREMIAFRDSLSVRFMKDSPGVQLFSLFADEERVTDWQPVPGD